MLLLNKKIPNFRMGPKMGPKNISPIEQRLDRMGYRLFSENIVFKSGENYRMRSYFRGDKCISVGDRMGNIRNSPNMK